jgi:hypothetical protein
MKPRPPHILALSFLGLTIFIILIHLKTIEYFVDSETNKTGFDIYEGNFKVTANLDNEDKQFLKVDLWFSHVLSDLKVKNLNLKLSDFDLYQIRVYQGMLPREPLLYRNFSEIPDSIRIIQSGLVKNDYFAYDYHFQKEKINKKQFLEIQMIIQNKGIEKTISQKIEIKRIKKIEFKVVHGDASVLLIPIFGFISLIFSMTILVKFIRQKNKNSA